MVLHPPFSAVTELGSGSLGGVFSMCISDSASGYTIQTCHSVADP